MRVYFVGTESNIIEEFMRVDEGSLVLVGYSAGIVLDLVAELEGESDILRRLAGYSRRRNAVLVCAVIAMLHGKRYHSVVVIDRGHIRGMSDETHHMTDGYSVGSTYRVYDTSLGMAGIMVAGDVYFPEVARLLARADSRYIIALAGEINVNDAIMLLRSYAYLCGRSVLAIVGNVAYIVSEKGDVLVQDEAKMLMADIETTKSDYFLSKMRPNIYNNVYIEK